MQGLKTASSIVIYFSECHTWQLAVVYRAHFFLLVLVVFYALVTESILRGRFSIVIRR